MSTTTTAPHTRLDLICETVAQFYGVPVHQIRAAQRGVIQVSWARQVAMALMWKFECGTLHELGGYFGRTHGAVGHALIAVKNMCETEPRRADEYQNLIEQIEGKLA